MRFLITLSLSIFCAALNAQTSPPNWELYDDFSGSTIDTGKWETTYWEGGQAPLISNGQLKLENGGGNGGEYRIEYTDAIESDVWITAEEGIIGNGDIIRRLYNTRDYSDRFYRAIRTDQ